MHSVGMDVRGRYQDVALLAGPLIFLLMLLLGTDQMLMSEQAWRTAAFALQSDLSVMSLLVPVAGALGFWMRSVMLKEMVADYVKNGPGTVPYCRVQAVRGAAIRRPARRGGMIPVRLLMLGPLLLGLLLPGMGLQAANDASMAQIFATQSRNARVLAVEAALARAQADHGVIPAWAADVINAKASLEFLPQAELDAEYDKVRHRMVALLNVWGRSLGEAREYAHFGATTVDIYDTVLVLQLIDAATLLEGQLLDIEAALIRQALMHKSTPMIGRTLGQHALPITFGKKLSTWLGENRRHIDRLRAVQAKLRRSAILKGAVGSYLGLGEKAMQIEQAFADYLLLDTPYIADWHGTRDVFAEYAQVLALIAASWGRIGGELFLLQTTDIGETKEWRRATAVGSSTMPHKNNPSRSEALVQYSRSIPRLAEVVLDDVDNMFERDNTSRSNRVLEAISVEAEQMLNRAEPLIRQLIVKPDVMRANLDRTNGLIMSQRIAFALAPEIGKQTANDALHELARQALHENRTLGEVFRASPLSGYLSDEALTVLLDPETYLGLAVAQTEAVINETQTQRKTEGL